MKAKAILFASVLLVGCQTSYNGRNVQQCMQSLSAISQEETEKFLSSKLWMSNRSSFAQEQDLWSSIGNELKMGIPENSRIREQKNNYLRNKSYLHDVTLRAEPYMYWIAEQIKKRSMPMELVLLPIVESAFNPHATSGANAAGIWQIIPSTGRNYGLKQTHNYDARRDVVASTMAALDMIQRLNKIFNGDWLLTIAAYNSGEGRVLKAIRVNRLLGKPTDFWSLSLPRETKIYVPKMLALSDIIKNNKRYGVQLPSTDEGRALARVSLNSPIDMKQVSDMTGISVSKLKAFNAGVKGFTLGANGPQYILVPQKNAEQLRESLASGRITTTVQPTLISNIYPARRLHYRVRSGDTLSKIALHLGVSTKNLRQWNNLHSTNLKIGQKLWIYTSNST